MNINTLQQELADLTKEGREILDAAEKDERDFTEEEDKRFKEIEARQVYLKNNIDRLQKIQEWENQLEPVEVREPETIPESEPKPTFEGPNAFGEFLQAVYKHSVPDHIEGLDNRLYAAASGASEGVLSDGGFLVQKDFSNQIMRRVYESGQVIQRVEEIPISSGSNGIKIPAVDETSRADGSRWGGVQVFWTAEAAEKTPSKPKYRLMELDLKKVTGLYYATDELIQDASALQAIAMQAFSEELTFKIEDSIINGTGGGQMQGILNSGALITVSQQAGQGAGTLIFENVRDMHARLHSRARQRAIWLIDQSCEPQLQSMYMTVGTGGVPVYMPAGGVSGKPYATLYGHPVIPIEYGAAVGTVGDICLFDLSQYVMITKGGMQTASSIHVRFIFDETVFRFVYRVDGQPTWNAALTPKSGGPSQSPFVVLETRT